MRTPATALATPSRQVEVRVLRGPDALADAEHHYRYLWSRTDPMPPMLEYAWARTWWDLHADEGELFLVLAEIDRQPVGMAPLYIRGRERGVRGALRTMCFLGTGEPAAEEVYGTNNGWLAAPEHQTLISDAVVDALREHRSEWDRVWLANIAPDARIASDVETGLQDDLLSSEITETCNWIVDVPATLDDYYARIPETKLRTKLRAVLKRADKAGVEVERARSVGRALEMFEELIEIHTRQWEGRGHAGACSSPVFREFHRRMIAYFAQQDLLWMLRSTVGEQTIAVRYGFHTGRTFYDYIGGIDQELRRHAPGIMTTLRLVEQGPEVGFDALDLLAGDYGYKHRVSNRQLPLVTLEGYGKTPAARAFVALRTMRDRVRQAIPRNGAAETPGAGQGD